MASYPPPLEPCVSGGPGGPGVGAGGAPGVAGGFVGGAGDGGGSAGAAACCAGLNCSDPASMKYVGLGHGSYVTETTFRYVGSGSGDFDMSASGKRWMWPLAILLVVLLVVTFTTLMLWPVEPNSTSVVQAIAGGEGAPGECAIWGDPHVRTFDSSFASFFEQGEYWIVKSPWLQIQGRYQATPFTDGLASLHDIAISGRFMKNHRVFVGPLEDGDIKVDWEIIMNSFPSHFNIDGLVSITYSGEGHAVDRANLGKQKRIVTIDLPNKVQVEVMRWANHINARITMIPREGGQDGHCGNFNEDPSDDTAEQIRARLPPIPPAESIFNRHVKPVHLPPHRIEECKLQDPAKYNLALRECGASEPISEAGEGCVFDVCFAGVQYGLEDQLVINEVKSMH